MEGSIAMFPPMMTAPTASVKSTSNNGVCGVRVRRPRLNFSSSAEIGNRVMTASHTSENLQTGQQSASLQGARRTHILDVTPRLAPDVAYTTKLNATNATIEYAGECVTGSRRVNSWGSSRSRASRSNSSHAPRIPAPVAAG